MTPFIDIGTEDHSLLLLVLFHQVWDEIRYLAGIRKVLLRSAEIAQGNRGAFVSNETRTDPMIISCSIKNCTLKMTVNNFP